jgi:hypothetical protein
MRLNECPSFKTATSLRFRESRAVTAIRYCGRALPCFGEQMTLMICDDNEIVLNHSVLEP